MVVALGHRRQRIPRSVSCPSATFCAAVDGVGNALIYNGSSWSSPSDIDAIMSTLRSVSCPSTTFCVAVDPVGNVFTYNGSPTTSVIIPSNGATLSGTTNLDATASNATSVEFRLFGGSYGYSAPVLCTATQTVYGWVCNWNTTTVPNGSYTLVSEAIGAGGTTFSSGVNITVKNPLPTTTILIPSKGATLSGTAVTLDASASNATSVRFVVFGGTYGFHGQVLCTATLTYYGWLCSWNSTTVPNGSYTLTSAAYGSGGSAFSSGISITVSNYQVTNYTAPGIDTPYAITAGPDGALWSTNEVTRDPTTKTFIGSSMGRITTAGVVTTYTDPSIRDRRDHLRTRRRPVVHQLRRTTPSGGSPPRGR